MPRTARVAVIGAGLSGLATAARLRATGVDVVVFEAGDRPGGLVRTETVDGHRFDTGATVLTMPSLLVDVLAAVDVDADEARRRLALTPVDPGYVMNYADGTSLAIPHDAAAIPESIASVFGVEAGDGVADLLRWLRRVYDAEFDTFIDRNFDGIADLCGPATRTAAAELLRLRTLGGLTGAVARHVADERVQRAFTFQALYAGLPPDRARAIYAIIADMDIGRGVYTPEGGMGRIGQVLGDALTDSGVEIVYRAPVTSLHRDADGRVRSVRTGDGEMRVDAVVATLERDAVARLTGERMRRRLRYSPSALVIHGVLPVGRTDGWRSGHHTVDFGEAWSQTFAEITRRRGRVMSDGSFLITRAAAGDRAAFVRDGLESVSVLAPTPNLRSADLDWESMAQPYAAEVLGVLAARGYAGIDDMRVLRVDHPKTWAAAGLPEGTPFSAAHTATQTGPLRTANRWPSISNLFLAGSATVPGVGIPPVLVSGGLAAARVTDLLRGETGER